MPTNRNAQVHVGLIILLYCVCFGAYNFVNVPFWDDWVLLQYGVDGLWELFKQTGRREHYFIIAPLVAIGQPMVWAVLSFVCWGIVALCVYFYLHALGWARGNAFWAALLTAVMPLNQARFALAMTAYSICAALFAIGMLSLAVAVRHGRLMPRIAAAALLTASFSTNSFLTMAWIAPATVFLVLRDIDHEKRFWPAARGTFRYWELFVLPVAYWISKTLFQPVYGLYEGYNTFKIGPLQALASSVRGLIAQVPNIETLRTFFPSRGHFGEALVVSAVICVAFVSVILLTRVDVRSEKGEWRGKWLWVFGLAAAAILALFPYFIVGMRPAFPTLWGTRHQTTLAVLAGILVFAMLRAILPARAVPAACVVVLFGCVGIGISASRQLLADVYETNAIIHSPEIAAIPDGTLVGVFEEDRAYRMFGRYFQFYELSGMLNEASPKDTLVAVSNYETFDPETGSYVLPGSSQFPLEVAKVCNKAVHLPQYGFGDVVANGTFAEVTLAQRSAPPNFFEGMGIAMGLLFDREGTIQHAVDDLEVIVRTRPFPEATCGHN